MKQVVCLFFLATSIIGCKKACVDCTASSAAFKGTICKSDYTAGAGKTAGAPLWPAYRDVLLASGCTDSK